MLINKIKRMFLHPLFILLVSMLSMISYSVLTFPTYRMSN